MQTIKDLVDELVWKYTSVLIAQPFEVAKTIMQVRRQDDPGNLDNTAADQARAKDRQASQKISMYDTEVCLYRSFCLLLMSQREPLKAP